MRRDPPAMGLGAGGGATAACPRQKFHGFTIGIKMLLDSRSRKTTDPA